MALTSAMLTYLTVTKIDENSFYLCSSLNEVHGYIINPGISVGANVFQLDPENYGGCTLYVPYGTSAAYQVHNSWSDYFGSI